MSYDKEKVDQAVLALLSLTMFGTKSTDVRAWKSHCWDAMDRLYDKGFIGDPKSKAKSVFVTPEGVAESERLFEELFGVQ